MSEKLRKSAAILLNHAEHGIGQPFPQWLVDCRRDIEEAGNPAPQTHMEGDGAASMIECLSAGEPFVFDPATNFLHADDGTVEGGIRYVPASEALHVTDEMVDRAWRAYQDFGWSTEEGMRRAIEAALAPAPSPHMAGYQERVAAAHHALFHDDPTDIAERNARSFEESIETAQAFGMKKYEAMALVEYTFGRPKGDPAKELGAKILTAFSLAVEAGIDAMKAAEADLEKLQRPETIARIRAKRSTRHGRGPLPGFDPSTIVKEG